MTNPQNPYGGDDAQQPGSSVPPQYPGASYPQNQGGYPQAGYQQPFNGELMEKKSVLPLVAFILSIIGLLLSLFVIPPIIFGVPAIIIAVIALILGKKKSPQSRRTWMNWVAIVLAVISFVIAILVGYAGAKFFMESGFADCASIQDEEQRLQCIQNITENQ